MTELELQLLKEMREDIKEIKDNMITRDQCDKRHESKDAGKKWRIATALTALGVVAAWVKVIFFK